MDTFNNLSSLVERTPLLWRFSLTSCYRISRPSRNTQSVGWNAKPPRTNQRGAESQAKPSFVRREYINYWIAPVWRVCGQDKTSFYWSVLLFFSQHSLNAKTRQLCVGSVLWLTQNVFRLAFRRILNRTNMIKSIFSGG